MFDHAENGQRVRGEFVDIAGERYYAIRHVDKMQPFFVSVVSSDDHWLFASSTGGLTAGRVSPANALFPYVTVDKIHESITHTGSRTLLRVYGEHGFELWEPFNREQAGRHPVTRNIFKNTLGNKLCFEEVNHDLQLAFRYTWMTSRDYGFVRSCELENLGARTLRIDLLDGVQNILPAGTPLFTQTNVSNLVDAYKWNELDESTGLAIMTLYSAITDRAEPAESLKATTVFNLGLQDPTILISSVQIDAFRAGLELQPEPHKRGIRGAYLVGVPLQLRDGEVQRWRIVADTAKTQKDVVALRRALREKAEIGDAITRSVEEGSDKLARILASGDGFQATAEEAVSVHHYANVLFNVLRGGIFFDQYTVRSSDFSRTLRHFNREVHARHRELLEGLPPELGVEELLARVEACGDPQLLRLAGEYLPLTFGRRHGDPSRPWNQFAIRLKDDYGNALLSYEGNWRDIFQNWEALALSFPGFIGSMIAKFVNASTMDGYNPYRITKEGIDWEVEDPADPWSYIGYWGDHQVIYLQKLLELSSQFYPEWLPGMLRAPRFCYANVPYRIKPFEALLEDPKATVLYDEDLAQRIEHRVATLGADGKLVLGSDGQVRLVNLLEKLLVTLLCKLGNLVVDGGIWLNTQRPEWNDANNALVGHGLSVVTLCYMRRYVRFLSRLLATEDGSFTLSAEVKQWLTDTASALHGLRAQLQPGRASAELRYRALAELGQAASRYRDAVYGLEGFSGQIEQPASEIRLMLEDALAVIDHGVEANRREDGLFNAYNLMDLRDGAAETESLYPMLEGQVAALSSGAIPAAEAATLLESLFGSSLYRPDQHSFMLYPDRKLPSFLEKNRISAAEAEAIPMLRRMFDKGDERIVARDAEGCYRFSSEFRNVSDLHAEVDLLVAEYGTELEAARPALVALYESVFHHKAFTGRSGTMFGFEGLGSIYWHMVSKLLLAAQENFFAALDHDADAEVQQRLGDLYYRIREGIGFNKTPAEYGAFPTDPYSHTPGHAGARQPGMTGQVKEEIITRFGELGLRVADGLARFEPALLRRQEFNGQSRDFRYLDTESRWQHIEVPAGALAFTWCQVPVIYRLGAVNSPALTITRNDGSEQRLEQLSLTAEDSAALFRHGGKIRRIELTLGASMLFNTRHH
ncbi:hypothetical protein [Wenzhouxiangella sp. XN24]|uniref:hypothetical protein n=1 Tax=Wenzhouxiangella sp. XN24 TaxID=2713569 RepID=UPI0013EC367F|nr:hypothetical protein [Wenzhouxiangella sp. XN24]NGX16261.1 hypothetical protein [Wenzhouxiangella sp. XN24]